ncbi:MAG: hypothetical protein WAO24_00270 [Peptococcia bacterium]
MDLHKNLIRRAITIAVDKAIENMQSHPERSSRNLLDLGLFFTKSSRLRSFYEGAKKILANPKNSYHQLIKRIIETVDLETVKTVSINFGFHGLNYGTKIIRKMQENMDHILPWLVAFRICEYDSEFLNQINSHITDGQELGIYSYLFIVENPEAIPEITKIVKKHRDPAFMLVTSPQAITEETATLLSKLKNLAISIMLDENLANKEVSRTAFQQLSKFKCLFGFHIQFTPNNAAIVSSGDFLRTMISHGCAYGSYLTNPEEEEHNKKLQNFINSERYGHGQSILVFDWLWDTEYVGQAILPGSDYLILNSADEASLGHKSETQQVNGSLTEVIKTIMPRKI